MMPQGRLDGGDILVGHADAVHQRTQHMPGLPQSGQRSGAETLVVGLKLLQHMQARAFRRLLLQHLVLLARGALQFFPHLAQPLLPLLDRPALRLRAQLLRRHAGLELAQPDLQPPPLLFQLNLLGRQLLQPRQVALLLQIQRGDLIAHPRQFLRRGKGPGLRLLQRLLLAAQFVVHLAQRFLPGGKRLPMPGQSRFARGHLAGRLRQVRLRAAAPLLGLCKVRHGFAVLRGKLPQTLFVELNPALVPVHLPLQLQPALLLAADLMLQLG